MPRASLPQQSEGRNRPRTLISPSILAADFARLADECHDVIGKGADWLHVDIMDGHFVPNISIGPCVVSSLRKHSDAFLDCHLMVSSPQQWVSSLAEAGADMFTFHIEAAKSSAEEVCKAIRDADMHVGVSICPDTPAEAVAPLVDKGLVDMVLVMTVNPGFGGQSFLPETMPKVKELRARYPNLHIEVDGGLSPSTIAQAAAAGANVIVAGSAVFKSEDRKGTIAVLREAVDAAAAAA